ncbi:receptor-type guanylate cyclase Gyc76C-like isoform X2 [Paramacrobiotus metropolitanus]|uniref:receptor-type guanylate cyclase Gyc76C-like isoform X2 n=1 Tax=Paramacrobiotus metropolitanus TaxID=2943436 RepID=UPI0024458C3A|nr:receptor-type guanylate cyclase Gyc76C-like isoform X2 [Paramacrobiotus metropolitanus]
MSGSFLCIIVIVVYGGYLVNGKVFRLGYITGSKRYPGAISTYERPGYQISGAISLAVNGINQNHPDHLLINQTLEFQYEETYGREDFSIQHTARLCLENISAIIGPQETCFHEARIATSFNVLMLSYFCQEYRFRDEKNKYSTFIHVKPHAQQISKSVASLLLKYNWKKVAFVYSVESDHLRRTAESVKNVLEEYGVQIVTSRTWAETYYVGFDTDGIFVSPFKQIIQEIKNAARIIVVIGYIDGHVGFMNAMEEEGLLDSGDYFVVGVYLEQYKDRGSDPAKYIRGVFEKEIAKKTIKAFRSFLAVIPTPSQAKEQGEFTTEVNAYLPKPPFYFMWDDMPQKNVKPEAYYLHDAVMIYARALNECLANVSECPNPRDGSKLAKFIIDRPYQSAMGYGGYIDPTGNAQGNYSLLALKENPVGKDWNVGLLDIGIFRLNNDNRSALPTLVLKPQEKLQWPFNRVPADEPPCGFDNSKCKEVNAEKDFRFYVTLGAIGGVVLVVIAAITGLLCYRSQQSKRDQASFLWKIEWKELNVEKLQAYLRAMLEPEVACRATSVSLTSLYRVFDVVFADLRIPKPLQTELGFYKNQVVAVKHLRKTHVSLTLEILKELKLLREIRNDNLCSFIGACLAPVCIVTEFCSRGSLKDVIYDENVSLDSMFMEAMLGDIVRGMCYLHMSSLKSHGTLKPTNCLVDSRFTVKITDYGLHEFKRNVNYDPLLKVSEYQQYFEQLLWTAPELLRDPYPPPAGTPAGDVYSFSLIVYEVYGRHGPFGRVNMTAQEIVTELRLGREKEPFRPNQAELMEVTDVPDYVLSVMIDCWNENPAARPDFQTIKIRLKVKPTIMDNVLGLLQRYANNLEDLVAERTTALEEEKKKTESLLYEILPRPVAEQLIKQERVEAEQFNSVTIFFSDIVGFTALSAESTPFEVVAFLNDLYTLFDSLLEHYDAYKVETIGDSYMVCSGLPIRNGDTHAGVIASMALHLLDAIQYFRIQHRPNQQLLLRVGIHSGPVVAGVVGRKMPRYCLFGDTVNTTSRYESTGSPQKIHCSPQCKALLDSLGGYIVEPRGKVHMKGKGDLLTYWLVDEDEWRKEARRSKDLSMFSDQNPSPILARWGMMQAKRRLSCFKKQMSPADSPRGSNRKLDVNDLPTSANHTPVRDEVSANNCGSLQDIITTFTKDLRLQCTKYQNGDVTQGMPLLTKLERQGSLSAACSRANSRERLNGDVIMVL